MAYFSNNDEFEYYWAKYCSKCIHWKKDETEEEGCPIIDLHWICQNNPDCGEKEKIQKILNFFIPRKNAINLKCKMFVSRNNRR